MENHCIIGDLLGTIVLEAGKRWEQHLGYTNPLDVGDFCWGTGSYQHANKLNTAGGNQFAVNKSMMVPKNVPNIHDVL